METASVITQDGIRTLKLPNDFDLDCSEFHLKRVGRLVLLIPSDCDPWQLMEESLGEFTDDFMEERNQPPNQDRGAWTD